mmetsp:Transcript_75836/g.203147  ORF Transcript_75836/g.203147 Transcript_75836/m.203147 type:complete len:225 (-) Transcript_75836:1320-1994(-)
MRWATRRRWSRGLCAWRTGCKPRRRQMGGPGCAWSSYLLTPTTTQASSRRGSSTPPPPLPPLLTLSMPSTPARGWGSERRMEFLAPWEGAEAGNSQFLGERTWTTPLGHDVLRIYCVETHHLVPGRQRRSKPSKPRPWRKGEEGTAATCWRGRRLCVVGVFMREQRAQLRPRRPVRLAQRDLHLPVPSAHPAPRSPPPRSASLAPCLPRCRTGGSQHPSPRGPA